MMRLYQFISSAHALEAIGLRRLKISRINQLNDPFEMLAGTQSHPVTRLVTRAIRDTLAEHLGMLCFSRDWYNPVMWGTMLTAIAGYASGSMSRMRSRCPSSMSPNGCCSIII